jgi:pilus assembly protein CpaC
VLNALAKDGLAHILAEPNLTVMSGQPASFQAGGEYPYPVLSGSGTGSSSGTVTIAFKQYGVLLNFLPTVLNDGRINLHVRPEYSELDTTNLLSVQTGSSVTLAAPSLKVRRVETTVELGSGESLAIAGMLQTTNSDNNSGIPGIGDTPILGALFRTNNMTREQTELVIIVTPIVVRPVRDIAQLRIPADGYKPAKDIDRLLLMRPMPNRDGRASAQPPGEAGFIVR